MTNAQDLLCNFQVYNIMLSTILTVLYIRSSELFLQLKIYILSPASPRFTFSPALILLFSVSIISFFPPSVQTRALNAVCNQRLFVELLEEMWRGMRIREGIFRCKLFSLFTVSIFGKPRWQRSWSTVGLWLSIMGVDE